MEKRLNNGFTLIELLVAVAVASILLGIGVPSFAQMIKSSRISANYNSVAQALYIARSEAVKSSEVITVCPRSEGEIDSCGSDWSKGLLVYVDNDPVITAATATLGAEDEVLYSQAELKKGSTLQAFASIDRTASTEFESYVLRYGSTGRTTWANGFFRLCDDDRGAEFSRSLNVAVTGDIRRGRPATADDRTPVDVFGRLISCP